MRASQAHTIELGGCHVEYREVASRSARKLRLRVGPQGVEVVRPSGRSASEVKAFLAERAPWVLDQMQRAERLRGVRRPEQRMAGQILFRGVPTRIRVEAVKSRARCNSVSLHDGEIIVRCGGESSTPSARSMETWLRKQARTAIEAELATVTARLRQRPARVYVMGQRTKWGNCSAKRNLSFNWRLILAPDFVLRYLVTHEAVHLVVPDHSARFWLTVQSLCPETERAKQWLCANQGKLSVDLDRIVSERDAVGCPTTDGSGRSTVRPPAEPKR